MRFIKTYLLISLLFLFTTLSWAEEINTSWLRTKTLSNALNPNLSVISDLTANSGPTKDSASNRLSLREIELGLQASLDPYARADIFISKPEAENLEVQEAYVTLTTLPWNLRFRGGKIKANFGRLNMIHAHELPQITAPIVLTGFLGAEGLREVGGEISRIFTPFNLFTEVSYAILNGLQSEETETPPTTQITDTNGNTVTVAVQKQTTPSDRQIQNFGHVGRLRFYKDLTDSTNIDLGFSGALHQPKNLKQTRMGTVDFTLRWKPLKEGLYHSFTWRTELFYSIRKLPQETDTITKMVTETERQLHRRGLYSYIELQPARRWKCGVRGDYMEAPELAESSITLEDKTIRKVEKSITRAISPYITFTLSEFNRFRLQYENRQVPGDDIEHRLFFQWTVILGPHGAHAF